MEQVVGMLRAAGDGTRLRLLLLLMEAELTVSELTGLLGPLMGRFVDRGSHRFIMIVSCLGMAVGTTTCATAHGVWRFGTGIVVLAIFKLLFDISVTGWVSEHVPPTGRGRVLGIIERRVPERHDAVANKLINGAVVAKNHFDLERKVTVQNINNLFWERESKFEHRDKALSACQNFCLTFTSIEQ